MKTVFTLLIFCLTVTLLSAQYQLDVGGNARIGDLLLVDGELHVSTSLTKVADFRASNPLIEFRQSDGTYSSFIQSFASDFYIANRLAGSLLFRTNNLDRLIINSNGNVGIGTNNITSKLVVNGAENNGTVATIEVRNGDQKIIMDGNEVDCTTGALHLNSNSLQDVLLRTTTKRADVTLKHSISSGASSGFSIENQGSNQQYWTFYSTDGDGGFELYYKGGFRGEYNPTTGNYSSISDLKLKQNIQPLENTLEKVKLLQPKSYTFKADKTNAKQLGFIAQEVAEVFPELVKKSPVGDTQEELYTLNYAGFGVVAVAAIQEMLQREEQLTQENEALRTKNEELENRLAALENAFASRLQQLEQSVQQCCQNSLETSPTSIGSSSSITDKPFLGQNTPNPFQSETVISYYLPAYVKKASLYISTLDGKMIKTYPIQATGSGNITVETNTLPAGIYLYSLVIDNALWESKQMVIANQ